MGRASMEQGLWVREVENPLLKPLNQWRDELFGYWMVVTDSKIVDGISMAIARYYGTDRITSKIFRLGLHMNFCMNFFMCNLKTYPDNRTKCQQCTKSH